MPGARMNVKEILNTDLSTIAEQARLGYHWWLDELAQMVPAQWKDRVSPGRRALVSVDDKGLHYGSEAGEKTGQDPTPRTADVVLAPNMVLTRMLDLPAMRKGDVQKLVGLELDRLTPFSMHNAVFDVEIVHRNDAAGTQKVRVGVLPHATAKYILKLLENARLDPAKVGVAGAVEGSIGQLNFLGGIRASAGGPNTSAWVRRLWIAVVILLAANVGVLTARDVAAVETLAQATRQQSTTVSLARRLRDRVDGEARLRSDLLRRRFASSPLLVLDHLTASLPRDAWVQRLEWDGLRLHIVGYAGSAAEVVAALRKSAFWRNVASRSGVQRSPASSKVAQSFDIVMEGAKMRPTP
jgi:general secretion pathway protein L